MQRFISILASFFFIGLTAGCGHGMAMNSGTTSLDTRTKSIAIFTLTIKNDVKPDYGLAPIKLDIESTQSGKTNFGMDGDWEGNGTTWSPSWSGMSEFPVSLALEPGRYTIGNVHGVGLNLLISWASDFRLNTDFDLPPGSVVYLGHVVMTNRQRRDGEEPSGIVWPSNAIAGISDGTMDISVVDNAEQDIPKFQAKYPCLKGVTITKAIMMKR